MSTDRARGVVIGTRGSELAMFQARQVAWTLQRNNIGLSVRIRKITTSGDKILDSPLARIGDKGLFVKEIEAALLAGEIDLAVHSAKDLPTVLPSGLVVGAFGRREDPRDVFIGGARSLRGIPAGGKVGTSSLRRRSQLLSLRPDLDIVDIRGNVDTRIRKIEEQGLDGTILAAAGVKRLEKEGQIAFHFSFEELLPAVGQGVIAIEVRSDDTPAGQLTRAFNDEDSAACVRTERALMRWLEGGCQVPIGAHAQVDGGRLTLRAFLGSLDGASAVRDFIEGSARDAGQLGEALAERMHANGGAEILAAVREANEGDGTGYWT